MILNFSRDLIGRLDLLYLAPDIPSVLIEMGFISNNSDLKELSNNEYLKKLMHQVSLVVEKYFIDNPN